ncbi:hypothetical protein BC827DRAFT_428419 [Russula dissimulans]|nr:hypothetical protein BC827DRAFT_428419 [Russula dissimulans]
MMSRFPQMDRIDIFLYSNDVSTPFLSIPKGDLRLMSLKPHRWMTYVMIAICGAEGDLTERLEGPPVELDTTFSNVLQRYYFVPRCPDDRSPAFVDHMALNDRVASTMNSPRSQLFRREVVLRDDACIVTRKEHRHCDAAHIIPRSKGNNYIEEVVRSRRHLYPRSSIEITDIDDVRNGILLNASLHREFGCGDVVFLRTPNFRLRCEDIPQGTTVYPEFEYRFTMQHIVPDLSIYPTPDVDARLDGSKSNVPPAILLDFMYGAAACQRWKTNDAVHENLDAYYNATYKPVLETPKPPTESFGDEETNNGNSDDPDWESESDLLDAMDKVMDISWRVRLGMIPREVAAQLQKQEEEEHLREQEAAQMKVLGWMGRTDTTVASESDTGV